MSSKALRNGRLAESKLVGIEKPVNTGFLGGFWALLMSPASEGASLFEGYLLSRTHFKVKMTRYSDIRVLLQRYH